MSFCFHFTEGLFQLAVRTNHEGAAFDTHHFLSIHVLFFPDVEGLRDFLVCVGEKREGDVVFIREFFLGLRGIGRDAQDHGVQLAELLVFVTKLGRFYASTRGVRLGIEIKDYRLPLEIF